MSSGANFHLSKTFSRLSKKSFTLWGLKEVGLGSGVACGERMDKTGFVSVNRWTNLDQHIGFPSSFLGPRACDEKPIWRPDCELPSVSGQSRYRWPSSYIPLIQLLVCWKNLWQRKKSIHLFIWERQSIKLTLLVATYPKLMLEPNNSALSPAKRKLFT